MNLAFGSQARHFGPQRFFLGSSRTKPLSLNRYQLLHNLPVLQDLDRLPFLADAAQDLLGLFAQLGRSHRRLDLHLPPPCGHRREL